MNRLVRLPKNLLITAAVLALMTAATAQARADGTAVDLHYVAVGVSKVPSLPANNQLRFAHKDAQDLAIAFKKTRGSLFREARVQALLNQKATRKDVLETLNALLVESRTLTLKQKGRPERSIRGHEAVVDAVRRSDADAAAQAMNRHIDEIAALLTADVIRDSGLGIRQSKSHRTNHHKSQIPNPKSL